MADHAADATFPASGAEALRRLIAGNERFVRGTTIHTQPRKEILSGDRSA